MDPLANAVLAPLATYCGIAEPTDQEIGLLTLLYHAAVAELSDGVCPMPATDNPQRHSYDLCVYAMVLDSLDHRGTQSESQLSENPAIRRKINQLKVTE